MPIRKPLTGINASHLYSPIPRFPCCQNRRRSRPVANDLASLTLKEASEGIHAKKFSPVDLTEACLATIHTLNPKTNAWITVMREHALKQAKALEKERPRGPLHGIPIGLKDNIDIAGTRTTAGSKTLAANIPTEDAEVTRRLLAAGAIIVG